MMWVYILRCSDNSLYTGLTNDVETRERWHNAGFGSSYTARRRPVRAVYAEPFQSLSKARARERQLKRWTVRKKEALIAGDLQALKKL